MKSQFNRRSTWLTLIIHAIILICTAAVAIPGILYGENGNQDGDNLIGLGYFKAFTMDCNILAGICALFVVFFAIGSLLKSKDITPVRVSIFRFVSTTELLLTAVTVVFFLAPMDALEGKSYWDMFTDDLFIFHFINPLLAILSFILLPENYRFKKKECALSVLPLIVYAAVYILMVVILKRWDDFYNFSFDGNYWLAPIVVIVMLALNYALARLLLWTHARAQAKLFPNE